MHISPCPPGCLHLLVKVLSLGARSSRLLSAANYNRLHTTTRVYPFPCQALLPYLWSVSLIVKLRGKFWVCPVRRCSVQLAREPVPGKVWQMASKCSWLSISGGEIVQLLRNDGIWEWSSGLLWSDHDNSSVCASSQYWWGVALFVAEFKRDRLAIITEQ